MNHFLFPELHHECPLFDLLSNGENVSPHDEAAGVLEELEAIAAARAATGKHAFMGCASLLQAVGLTAHAAADERLLMLRVANTELHQLHEYVAEHVVDPATQGAVRLWIRFLNTQSFVEAQELLGKSVDNMDEKFTQLTRAGAKGDLCSALHLLRKGARVETKNLCGTTASRYVAAACDKYCHSVGACVHGPVFELFRVWPIINASSVPV